MADLEHFKSLVLVEVKRASLDVLIGQIIAAMRIWGDFYIRNGSIFEMVRMI